MQALKLEKVSFSYNSAFALKEISLDIAKGAFLALIGPNGSGKTTLLRLMSNILKPHKGKILLEGQPLEELSPRQLAKKIAVISSEQFFQFPFRVSEVVAMGRFPHLGRFQRMSNKDLEIIEEVLQKTEVAHLKERSISQLSSGERQRVLIARALAQNPAILMLDEPNAHLDINHLITIFHLLRSLNQEHSLTVIVVLHDLSAAAAFCKTIGLLHQGNLIKYGTPQEVITEETLHNTYGAQVTVHKSPTGGYPQISFHPL